MVEYSILSWVLLVALMLFSTVRILPGPNDGHKNVIETFLEAYQTYYDSHFYVLNLPFP